MPFPFAFPFLFDASPDTMYVVIQEDRPRLIKGSLSVDTRIEERSVASFVIEDVAGTASYQRGEPVKIYDTGDNLIFSGFIADPSIESISPAGGLYHSIQCMDNHYLADKRRVALSYINQTCGFIVNDIYAQYLALEGVGIGTVETGATLVEAIFNYVRASDALDALAEKAGKIWYIDQNRNLYFVDRSTVTAPWNITDNDQNRIKGFTTMSGGNTMYRNRQYIRGGRDVTLLQTETFTGDGNLVAFPCGYALNAVPTITVNGVGQTVGVKGVDDTLIPLDFYWAKGDAVVTARVAPLNLDTTIVAYIGEYPVLVLATDEVQITAQQTIEGDSTTGFVDDIADEPKLDDKDAALDSANAKLDRFCLNARHYNYSTYTLGLRSGQLQTITDIPFGLVAEEMLIESVTFNGQMENTLHHIIAIQGPDQGSWAQYFKRLASQKEEVFEKLNVGGDQILIILVGEAEGWDWGEAFDVTVTVCPFPAATLYPEPTLYPC